ncbi:HNH endonuclease [Vibrio coralliirubri]|uniref:HNH endonuclease n=1 Tax=Vibrio coralliirubri TaxID=1516159 RepID=UPI002FD408A7
MIHFPKTQNQAVIDELARQKGLAAGKYDFDDIWTQLSEDFHDKCYICGDTCSSPRIEHFRPHNRGADKDRKFDWQNLMLACEHCNAIKSNEYEQLIDCCQERPDQHIRFSVQPAAQIGQHSIVIDQLSTSNIHADTKNLLEEVYSGTTKCKQIGAKVIVNNLLGELNSFDDLIQEYQEDNDEELLEEIEWELNRESKFTAFKRWVVRDSEEYRPLFEGLIAD